MSMPGRGVDRPPLILVLLGVVTVAVSLRGPIVAVAPVLPDIAADLSLGSTAVGLLATAPVVAFSLAAPLAALVSRRVGPEAAVLIALLGTLVSQVVRAVPTPGSVVVGTVLLGLSITIGNVVVPVVIRRDVVPSRVGAMTGVYAAFLNVGSLLTALLTAPLAARYGWPVALALWALLPTVGLAIWAVLVRSSGHGGRPVPDGADSDASAGQPTTTESGEAVDGSQPSATPRPATSRPATPGPAGQGSAASRRVLALRATWLLAAAFSAQAFSYYAFTTWLPTYLAQETGLAGTSAGALASTFQAWGILGALLVPVLARVSDLRWTAGFVGVGWLSLSLGVLIAPGGLHLWLALGGLAQAGGFTVVFTGVALAAGDSREATGISAVVQTVGYLVAASSGPVVGAVHAATGGWTVPLRLLVGTTATFAVLSLLVAVHVERVGAHRIPEAAAGDA